MRWLATGLIGLVGLGLVGCSTPRRAAPARDNSSADGGSPTSSLDGGGTPPTTANTSSADDASAPIDAGLCAAPPPNPGGQPPAAPLGTCGAAAPSRPPPSLVATLGGGGGGALTASLADGDGGWYLAGNFTDVGGVAVSGLAHVLATGEVDTRLRRGIDLDPSSPPIVDLTPNRSRNVRAMARLGTALFVVGGFDTMAGAARRYFAAFDVVTGELLPWDPRVDSNEACTFAGEFGYSVVTTDDHTVYAGFCTLVALDATTAAPATGFVAPDVGYDYDSDAEIVTLAVRGDTLCVDGFFDLVDAPSTCPARVARLGMATFDRRTGRLLP